MDGTSAMVFNISLIILILAALVVWQRRQESTEKNNQAQSIQTKSHVCTKCGFSGTAKMPGSGWIELILYFFYFLPGVFYSIWRRREIARNICPNCGMKAIVPASSPAATNISANKPIVSPTLSTVEQLEKLSDLKDMGAITTEEFKIAKKQILKIQDQV